MTNTGREITLRRADSSQARRLHALITANLAEGHLLPRTLPDLVAHAERFIVAMKGRTMVGCAELAPLGPDLAEVRSLAVARSARQLGVGAMLVGELRRHAQNEGYETLCAFTQAPGYFIRLGFSIVPHLWVPEKIFRDCVKCPLFRQCGKYAMVVPLARGAEHPVGITRDDAREPVLASAGDGAHVAAHLA
jgi:amino-acid N-acetyltransferase